MRFYPHGGAANMVPFLQSASAAISSSYIFNPNRPIPSASIALAADIAYQGPQGPPGANQTVTGPVGETGPIGQQGPRGFGSYTGSATTAICCTPFDSYCVGVDLYTYDVNCVGTLSCIDIVTCGGSNSSCQ